MRTPTKLRLILTEECRRNCTGCCNKDWDLRNLPVVQDYRPYSMILLTGGEPMLHPEMVIQAYREIRESGSIAKVILYTAEVSDLYWATRLLGLLNGMTVTLHKQSDVKLFRPFADVVRGVDTWWRPRSLRLNIFRGIDISKIDIAPWRVKAEIDWIPQCPLPEGEVLMRWRKP